MNLLLLEDADFLDTCHVRLQGRRLQHLREVHRAEVGSTLRVGRIGGLMGQGQLLQLDAQQAELRVALDQPPPAKLPVTLVLALPRPKMLKRTLQTIAAMGVPRLVLLNSYRVEKSFWQTPFLDAQAIREQLLLGQTRDDAAGEAFDKVGKMLGLPYPGGPEIEKEARDGNPNAFDFPRPMLHDPHLDFSFSGLKTAVLYTLERGMGDATRADLAASFQTAVIEILVEKTLRAARESGRDAIALSGGVSLNRALRAAFETACERKGFSLLTAAPALCTDNAAMIAFAALLRYFEGQSNSLEEDIHPNLPIV